jgi:hypothetical protein
MATTPTKLFAVPQGKVYIASRNASGQTTGLVHVGDCDESKINISQTFFDQEESMSGTRASMAHIVTKTDVSVDLGLNSVDGANLAKAFYGDVATVAAGTVTGEAITGYNGAMSLLKYPGVSAVTVKKGATTLVAGTDYEVDTANGTITILAGSTQVPAGAGVALTVDYTHGGLSSKVKALTQTQKDYVIVVEVKSAIDGLAQRYVLHRVALNAAATLSLIATGANKLSVSGKLLPAPEIAAGDTEFSQYFTITQK